jgi:two-component system NarL family sensor kinase
LADIAKSIVVTLIGADFAVGDGAARRSSRRVRRVPLIALIALLVWLWEVDHWLLEMYAVVLGSYAAAAPA